MQFLKASLLGTLLCVSLAWGQFAIPEKPQQQTSVYDYIALLTDIQHNTLEQKLLRYSDSTSTQMVIAIIGSTEGENINFLGAQWGQQWGIGQADKDNGILLLLAKNDRRVAISTGYGVEGALTDLMSRRIIESVIIPEFKKGNYYGGLDRGVDAIVQVLRGEFTAARPSDRPPNLLSKGVLFFILCIIIILVISRSGRNNRGGRGGWRDRGPDLWDIIILSSLGRNSSSSRSWSGGGFDSGGFGGGGFGGGGASGGW